MKLVAYPVSTLEPRKIAVYENDKAANEKARFPLAEVFADGSVFFSGDQFLHQQDLKKIVTIQENFSLFWDNVENINPPKD